MTIGERIKQARKNAGLTQKKLGEKLGISYQTVAQWENNLRHPKLETLQKIAGALNISVEDLFGVDRENRTVTSADKLLLFFDDLNFDGQQKAIERVHELTEIPRYRAADSPLGLPRHIAITVTEENLATLPSLFSCSTEASPSPPPPSPAKPQKEPQAAQDE